jgi:hypothetical protein
MDMRSLNFPFTRILVASLSAAAFVALPLVASAQQPYGDQPPPYGQQQQQTYSVPPPPYGNQNAIKGTISGFDGQWIVYMHDEKGYTDHVTLHQGTIINPTGIKLIEGMRVTIYGYAQGSTFEANRVDVAYSPYSPYYGANGEPAYGYGDNGYGYGGGYGGGYGYGSPYGYGYGSPYGYGGGPYIGLGINWGWGWGWGWPGWGWGWPGWGGWWGGWPGYYGGYPCCGGRTIIINHPRNGGGFPGGHGTIHGNVNGGPWRGGMPGGGTMHAPVGGGGGMRAPVSGGGGGMHAGGGGRPPHR